MIYTVNPEFDLVFERTSTLSIDKIWQGWTDPITLMKWFCPKPWKVADCRIDLRPGGEFYTLMEGPNGEKMPNHGCFLHIKDKEQLIWTNMMTQNFRPCIVDQMGFPFVGKIQLIKTAAGTLYKAIVSHADVAGRKQHEQMGFQEGWGLAFDQLVQLNK